jgi:hypothetical protein
MVNFNLWISVIDAIPKGVLFSSKYYQQQFVDANFAFCSENDIFSESDITHVNPFIILTP